MDHPTLTSFVGVGFSLDDKNPTLAVSSAAAPLQKGKAERTPRHTCMMAAQFSLPNVRVRRPETTQRRPRWETSRQHLRRKVLRRSY
jgi:hypothetical protein